MLQIPNVKPTKKKVVDIERTAFNPDKHTFFLFHGYLGQLQFHRWQADMADALLWRNKNCNVFVGSYNSHPPYYQSLANIRLVSRVIANAIIRWNLDPKKITFIAHSLGASLAGYVSDRLRDVHGRRLYRISVLDATRLGVDFDEPPSTRLDREDADFVDNIRTDVPTPRHTFGKHHYLSGIGASGPIAHIEFLPNGGKQPKCESRTLIQSIFYFQTIRVSQAVTRFGICDHYRAIDYFIESIRRPHCPFIGVRCPSWTDFEYGNCIHCSKKGDCAKLGYSATDSFYPGEVKYPAVYYMKTGMKQGDLCRFQYLLNLVTSGKRKKKSKYADKGNFYVILVGRKGKYISRSIQLYGRNQIGLMPGTRYDAMISAQSGKLPKEVHLIWSGKKKIKSSKIQVKHIHLFNVEKQKGLMFCPINNVHSRLKHKVAVILKRC